MRAKYSHAHSYKITPGGLQFRCTKIGCPHTISKFLLVGRNAECPYCQQLFTITEDQLRRKILHCMLCTKNGKPLPREAAPYTIEDNLDNALNELLNDKRRNFDK